jgi:transcriptional regulator with XRE-family HTH domain
MKEDLSQSAGTISHPPPTQEDIVVSAVRAGRLALGWTQGDLATASGVSEVSIARLETSAISPRLGTISKIQGALQVAGVAITLNQPAGGFTLALSPAAVAESRRRYGTVRGKGLSSPSSTAPAT